MEAKLTPELKRKRSRSERGTFLIPYFKDADTELYRQALTGVHIPRLMMDEVKSFFEERKSK